MTLDPWRLAEHVHGHLGWLAAASLIHPAIVLRSRTRRAHLAVGLATGLVTIAAALGGSIYVAYTEELRRRIYAEAPSMGLLMERKEHLAFGAVLLAWAGAAAYVAARRAGDPLRGSLRTIAFRAFVAAAALSVVAAALGTALAAFRSF